MVRKSLITKKLTFSGTSNIEKEEDNFFGREQRRCREDGDKEGAEVQQKGEKSSWN